MHASTLTVLYVTTLSDQFYNKPKFLFFIKTLLLFANREE